MRPALSKWRPTLGMIVFVVLATVLALPFAGINFFRLFENELVRQTEIELIGQGAVLAAVFAQEAESRLTEGLALGPEEPMDVRPSDGERYRPLLPRLNLARDEIRESRPDPRPATHWPEAGYLEIGARLEGLARETQVRTLAGFRILDPHGTIIAGRDDVGQSLAHVEEVAAALTGQYGSALRHRDDEEALREPPAVYAISRGTRVRVFVAIPVIVQNRVAGVVYASRTPSNIVKYLYGERRTIFLAALTVVAAVLIVGFVFVRTITRPLQELIGRTQAIGEGDREAIRPLSRHGTREIATLSQSFFTMAHNLFDRSDFVATFAAHVSHELKSPLTSIQGAAELLRDAENSMTVEERRKFLDNIISDTRRLDALLQRLRELARADKARIDGRAELRTTIADVAAVHPAVVIETDGDDNVAVAMTPENASIVFSHLIDNAELHNASEVTIRLSGGNGTVRAVVRDNGDGVSSQNSDKVFDTFFTTRRESGGTGMGLSIVRSMLVAHGGSIRLLPAEGGATFELRMPASGSG